MRQGIGIYEKGKYKSKENNRHTKEYKLWFAMLTRCYSDGYHKKEPTYKDCTVSENFKNFQYFAEWCNDQIGFNKDAWQLDKDILVKGNKIYSEATCCFVPREVNSLFGLSKKARGAFPVGVYRDDTGRSLKPYKAVCPRPEGGNQKSLGRYHTPEEAFYAYKKYKEHVIKSRAEYYKDKIDHRAYNALLSYEVEITD